jgi:hypothetical protein
MQKREGEDTLRGRQVHVEVAFSLIDGFELEEMMLEKLGNNLPQRDLGQRYSRLFLSTDTPIKSPASLNSLD